MKKYIIYALAFILSSCNDFLDETPKGNLIPETINDYAGMFNDLFNPIGANNSNSMNAVPLEHSNMHDNLTYETVYYPSKITTRNKWEWNEEIHPSSTQSIGWNRAYKCIFVCNYIIENIDDAEEELNNLYTREYIKAAAKVTRAYVYFHLVNGYGKHYDASTAATDMSIPMPLESDINIQHGRSSVKTVYEQIFKDLKESFDDLPDLPASSHMPSKAAVYGFYAKLYLYMGDYQKAYENAEACLNIKKSLIDWNTVPEPSPNFPFVPGYPRNLYADHPEVIWHKAGRGNETFYNYSDNFVNSMDKENDLRYVIGVSQFMFATPVNNLVRADNYTTGINVGEMFLIAAEGRTRIGGTDNETKALELLNQLRKNRYKNTWDGLLLKMTSFDDKHTLLDEVLHERRIETARQGCRWYDLKRLNREERYRKVIKHRKNDGTFMELSYDSPRYILPIPSSVIKQNPLLNK